MNGTSAPKKETRKSLRGINKEKSIKSESESEQDDNTGIRCICNDNTDHGLMIQCEKCSVWQHSICVGIRGDKNVPKHYYCENCSTREFKCPCAKNDTPGKVIQCSTCPTWQHIRCLGRSTRALPKPYRCPNCDPSVMNHATSVKLRKKKKGSSEFEFITIKELRDEMEEDYFLVLQKNSKLENVVPPKITDYRTLYIANIPLLEKYFLKLCAPDDKEKIELNVMLQGLVIILRSDALIIRQCFEEIARRIEELENASMEPAAKDKDWKKGWSAITENVYASDLKPANGTDDQPQAESPKSHESSRNFTLPTQESDAIEVLPVGDRWGLFTKEALAVDHYLLEYLGNVVDAYQVNYRSIPSSDRAFMLLRSSEELCVDARKIGNNARFIRRSCTPNAAVKEAILNELPRYGVFTQQDINEGGEVTVEFDFPWKMSVDIVDCACALEECPVTIWFKERKALIEQLSTNLRGLPAAPEAPTTDDPQADTQPPKRRRLDSPPEVTSPTVDDLKDLGREERKIAMLMKSFEKMENRQNRKRKASKDPDYKTQNKKSHDPDDEDQQDYSPPPSEPRSPVSSPRKGEKPGRKKRALKPGDGSEEKALGSPDVSEPDVEMEDAPSSPKTALKSRLKSRVKAIGGVGDAPKPEEDAPKVDAPPARKKPGRKPAQSKTDVKSEPVEVKPDTPQEPSTTNAPLSPTPSSSGGAAKFGKKAWLMGYQEEQTQSQAQTVAPVTSPIVHSSSLGSEGPRALKKKMLDSFRSEQSDGPVYDAGVPVLTPSSSLTSLDQSPMTVDPKPEKSTDSTETNSIEKSVVNESEKTQEGAAPTNEISIVSTTWTPKAVATEPHPSTEAITRTAVEAQYQDNLSGDRAT